ncbi:uncharacterized protein HKW66_Vig0031270 [Vigna angularis]|uniref:Uncharacterized protein n=2 Tax=Phaseolus angularis TaxID=3914 RepID=A0A8T0LE79_PHAAN|nr:uncharacterized protein HKW66_Vig0031270 [Vigna angularis]BAT82410.1 hypothetical protein VIGAN_03242300 [Vigna angularis var. angularis]
MNIELLASSTLAVVLLLNYILSYSVPKLDLRTWMYLFASSIILSYSVLQTGSSDMNITTEATSFLLCPLTLWIFGKDFPLSTT